MCFLVDAQLPPALARWLEDHGHRSEHVVDRDMARADDREVWDCAVAEDAAIITKDEDFAIRRSLANSGPTIVWIRRGNTSRRELLRWFEPLLPAMLDAIERGETVIEVV